MSYAATFLLAKTELPTDTGRPSGLPLPPAPLVHPKHPAPTELQGLARAAAPQASLAQALTFPSADPEPGVGPGPALRRRLAMGTDERRCNQVAPWSAGGRPSRPHPPRHRVSHRVHVRMRWAREESPASRSVSPRTRPEVRAHPALTTCPQSPPGTRSSSAVGRAAPTFAVCDVGGAVEVCAGVARTGDAVVLAKLGLVGADRAADAPVGGGVVVVAGGAVHCGGGGGRWERAGGILPGAPCP